MFTIEKVENSFCLFDGSLEKPKGRWFDDWTHIILDIHREIFSKYTEFNLINFTQEEQERFYELYNSQYALYRKAVLIKPLNDVTRTHYTRVSLDTNSTIYRGDSGLDLICPETIVVKAGDSAIIDFGIACETCSSFWLLPRSSIGKTPLRLSNSIGLIDQGYRGPLRALVDHIKPNEPDFVIEAGTRLFQIALPSLEKISNVVVTDKLSTSDRGPRGFGSTGK